jgi:hypothetical protein
MDFRLFSKKNKQNHSWFYDIAIVSIFIFLGTISRFLLVGLDIQPFPNFEIIMVLTFVSLFLIRPSLVFIIPLSSMILSDLLLGNPVFIGSSMNKIVLFTYTGFLISAFLFQKTSKTTHHSLSQLSLKSIGLTIGIGMVSTLLFDVWTNTGWWYIMYPHSIESLASVFISGVPFMIYHQLSTVFTFLTVAIPMGYLLTKKYHITLPKPSLKTIEKIPFIAVTSVLIIFSFTGSTLATPNQTDIWLEDASQTSVTITVKGSSWELSDQFVLVEESSVLEVLEFLSKTHDIMVKTSYDETYKATLIVSIQNDINGEDGYYWQYLVNGEAPMTGADNTFVSNGDSITWYFNQFS